MNIGENIKNLRRARGLTQEQVAERVGVSRPFIAQVERGTKVPTLAVGALLATVLECDLNDFIK